MRTLIVLVILQGATINAFAQDSRAKMAEIRAREFHRVIGVDDKAQWKKFITENYSQALIDKSTKAVVKNSGQNNSEVTTIKPAGNVEEKAEMFRRLHQDFGDSKIRTLTPKDENLEMILDSSNGLKGTFNLKFDNKAPYLIDGIGIEVGGVNR